MESASSRDSRLMGKRTGFDKGQDTGASRRGEAVSRRTQVGGGPGGSLNFSANHVRIGINVDGSMTKGQLMRAMYERVGTPFVRLFSTSRGYTALLSESDAVKFTGQDSINKLRGMGVSIVLPPDHRARRSIFVRGLDETAGSHPPAETVSEIEGENDWARDKIDQVVKIKNYTHVMKVIFKDCETADKAVRDGFLMFSMRVAPDQIKKEVFVPLRTCFTCYKFESHSTYECPEKDKTPKCSECAAVGHTWRSCSSSFKCCLNCGGPHRTLAMACPVKKGFIEKKRRSMNTAAPSTGGPTYAAMASAAGPSAGHALTREECCKIATCVEFAKQYSVSHEVNYERVLNATLRENDLPGIKIPKEFGGLDQELREGLGRGDRQPSLLSVAGSYISDTIQDQATHLGAGPVESSDGVAVEMREISGEKLGRKQKKSGLSPVAGSSVDAARKRVSTGTGVIPKLSKEKPRIVVRTRELRVAPLSDGEKHVTSGELGLKLYFSETDYTLSPGWSLLLEMIRTGRCKYKFSSMEYSEEQVVQLLDRRLVQISRDDILIEDISSFRKIHRGRESPRTPPKAKRRPSRGASPALQIP